MKIAVDITIFTKVAAVGNAHGVIELPVLPRSGESVSFVRIGKIVPPLGINGYSGILKVVSVTHFPDNLPVMLEMEDVVVGSESEGRAILVYLESAFGLAADFHEKPRAEA